MTPEVFDNMVNDVLDNCKKVLSFKSGYGTEENRLSNFVRAGELQNIKPTTALMGMLAKHTIALNDYMINYELGTVPLEAEVEEKIIDHINYLLLLRGLLIDNGIYSVGEIK